MSMDPKEKIQKPFEPHPNLSDEINKNIMDSKIEGGVWLDKMRVGEKLNMVTRNRNYTIWRKEDEFYIKGHPKFCPDFVKVNITGSTWGESMLKMKFVGNGMFLEFQHPEYGRITTSRIKEVRPISEEEEAILKQYEQEMKNHGKGEEQR